MIWDGQERRFDQWCEACGGEGVVGGLVVGDEVRDERCRACGGKGRKATRMLLPVGQLRAGDRLVRGGAVVESVRPSQTEGYHVICFENDPEAHAVVATATYQIERP